VASRTFVVYLTWVSNPEGTVNVGDKWTVDDIDLYVNNDDYSRYYYSVSSYNSTEAVKFYWNETGNVDYLKIRARVYNHKTNQPIYLAVAVTVI
jgi:hypothetical protein